jgi:hypothetical protein
MKTKITLFIFAIVCTLAQAQNVTIIPTGITPAPAPSGGWSLAGNGVTNPATDFVGTTDIQPLVVKTNNIERLRVTDAGRVGIGLSTPRTRLHVSSSFNPGTYLITGGTVAAFEGSKDAHISLMANSSYSGAVNFASDLSPIQGFINYDNPKNEMNFGTNSASKMTITSTGNVGIGQTVPLAKLDVNGEIRLEEKTYLLPLVAGTYDPLLRNEKSYVSFNHLGYNYINSIEAPSANGVILYICNLSDLAIPGNSRLELVHNYPGSLGNKILTPNGANITITGYGGAVLVYDSNAWRVLSFSN